jgi:hypothetical protein
MTATTRTTSPATQLPTQAMGSLLVHLQAAAGVLRANGVQDDTRHGDWGCMLAMLSAAAATTQATILAAVTGQPQPDVNRPLPAVLTSPRPVCEAVAQAAAAQTVATPPAPKAVPPATPAPAKPNKAAQKAAVASEYTTVYQAAKAAGLPSSYGELRDLAKAKGLPSTGDECALRKLLLAAAGVTVPVAAPVVSKPAATPAPVAQPAPKATPAPVPAPAVMTPLASLGSAKPVCKATTAKGEPCKSTKLVGDTGLCGPHQNKPAPVAMAAHTVATDSPAYAPNTILIQGAKGLHQVSLEEVLGMATEAQLSVALARLWDAAKKAA